MRFVAELEREGFFKKLASKSSNSPLFQKLDDVESRWLC